ncbi:glutathione S-transferase C-terminal domain-containing protein [Streptomyces sp. NL15-2K]|uniref:glutathione S-transferase C-terminal domain-containing protein n=1 Tax=Streptomyces sp. NL15-2K TaxID=376149 RepID=UPI000F57F0E0|nr:MULTISPECIES: glutathione S-transferase C-terminal domain-containing protein [Actinomycetes]WKX07010.1 glutathione S-transferase C-terminal domain-containing protein [Kutzneria buriramensis]GCB43004.1 glutathione S-transferase domain protein [Streptomyces sp. NL15-2K]
MSVTRFAVVPSAQPAPTFRGRLGRDARSGHYAVPRRYRLHLSTACPDGLRIAVAHGLLGLDDICPVTFLDAVPDCPDGGHSALRPLYDASAHRYTGAAAAPVLSDDWSGRIVSTHAPDIIRDLARHFGGGRPALHPCGMEGEIEAVERLCAQGIEAAAQHAGRADGDAGERAAALGSLFDALGRLERRLAPHAYVLGDQPTAADIELWVALVRLDTVHRHHLDAAAVHRIAGHPVLWAYARRLAAHPAFGTHLDLDGIARRHHAHCQGLEAAGAAVQILDWAGHVGRRA